MRLEDSGMYKPEINYETMAGINLQVFSPVPKPSISMTCNSEQTECTITCIFNKTDDLGEVQIFWILDNRREKGGSELQITQDTDEELFICNLNNSVSSMNSIKLKNPLWTRSYAFAWISLGLSLVCAIVCLFVCPIVYRNSCKPSLWGVRKMILKFFRERDVSQPYDERERLLLKVHKMIVAFFREQMKGSPFEEELNSLDDPNTPEPAENQDPALFSETIPQPDFPDGNISTFERSEQMLPPDSRDL